MTAHRRMIQLPVDDIAMGDSGTVCRHRGVGPRARFAACLAAICLGSLLAAPAALAEFHVTSIDGSVSGPNGEPFTQAGGHPYAITTTVSFDVGSPQESAKDIHVHVPAGLIGNPRAVATCTESQLANATEGASPADCPGDSQVGLVTFETTLGPIGPGPLFNMQAPAGEPAQFGIKAFETSHLDASVRTGGDYGIDIDSDRTSQGLPLTGVTVELWGVPSDPSHDAQRYCGETNTPGCAATGVPRPLLTLPTSCQGPLTTSVEADSWEHPGDWSSASFVSHDNEGNPIGVTGCTRPDFSPTLTVTPDTTVADSPSGLTVGLHLPQNESPEGIAEADLKKTVVALPPGVTVNPAAANGLGGCTPAQIGLDNANQPSCPDNSKIGSVEINTPLLDHPVLGSVYLATQSSFQNSLLAIYIVGSDPQTGTLIKLGGTVSTDPSTGQLTTTFDNNPQLPFSDLKLTFFDGPRAALATPEQCGTYETAAALTAWSGIPAVMSISPFTIDSGCVSGFSPTFAAGTQNAQAGAYSPFVLSFQRSDADQDLSGLSAALPPGAEARLAGVQECSDAQLAVAAANTGAQELAQPSCPAGSQVGTVQTGAGVGPDPLFLGGKAYLTGPYKGAPYGLAVVVPAVAGPFDLGTVVVRQALFIDPTDAHVTAVSDPLPQILDGIPIHLRRVNATLDRPDFTTNPTSCEPMAVTGALTSVAGVSSPVSSRFQVGGCSGLAFHPSFSVSTQAKTSRSDGASLSVKITFPHAGPQGGDQSAEANIARVHVELPKSLPARLTTLRHACTETQFAANPAGCPAESVVGHAKAITPILNNPLEGPAYFVSHGGAAWPELIMVLQGEGITIQLNGETFINSKTNITSNTFPQVPDAPVSSFELTLPEGEHSALAALGDLCRQDLAMPTAFVAQNGATYNQETKIKVEGCSGTPSVASKKVKGKTFSVISKKIEGETITLKIAVPSGGRLKVSGKGLSSASRRANGRETITVTVHEQKRGRLKTEIQLSFKPANGKSQRKSVAVVLNK